MARSVSFCKTISLAQRLDLPRFVTFFLKFCYFSFCPVVSRSVLFFVVLSRFALFYRVLSRFVSLCSFLSNSCWLLLVLSCSFPCRRALSQLVSFFVAHLFVLIRSRYVCPCCFDYVSFLLELSYYFIIVLGSSRFLPFFYLSFLFCPFQSR